MQIWSDLSLENRVSSLCEPSSASPLLAPREHLLLSIQCPIPGIMAVNKVHSILLPYSLRCVGSLKCSLGANCRQYVQNALIAEIPINQYQGEERICGVKPRWWEAKRQSSWIKMPYSLTLVHIVEHSVCPIVPQASEVIMLAATLNETSVLTGGRIFGCLS